jgi:hypothetical protein
MRFTPIVLTLVLLVSCKDDARPAPVAATPAPATQATADAGAPADASFAATADAVVAEVKRLKELEAGAVAAGKPRNFVCERVAVLNPKAKCDPELTDEEPLHTHMAVVTVEDDKGKTVLACGMNAAQLSMVCGPLQAPPPTADTSPSQKPPLKK